MLSSSKKNNCILSSDTVASGAFVSACVSVGGHGYTGFVAWKKSTVFERQIYITHHHTVYTCVNTKKWIPVVPQKVVAAISMIGNLLKER